MARLLPELDVVEDRRAHLGVAALGVLAPPQLVSSFQTRVPFGCQNGEPGDSSENMNRSELPAELAVVAGARLLEPLQVLLEVLLREEGGAVDAGEHLAAESPRQ